MQERCKRRQVKSNTKAGHSARPCLLSHTLGLLALGALVVAVLSSPGVRVAPPRVVRVAPPRVVRVALGRRGAVRAAAVRVPPRLLLAPLLVAVLLLAIGPARPRRRVLGPRSLAVAVAAAVAAAAAPVLRRFTRDVILSRAVPLAFPVRHTVLP